MAEGCTEGTSARGRRRCTIADAEIAPKRGETARRTKGFMADRRAPGHTGQRRDRGRGAPGSRGERARARSDSGVVGRRRVRRHRDTDGVQAWVTADAISGRLTADKAATLLRAHAARLKRDSRPFAEVLAGIGEQIRGDQVDQVVSRGRRARRQGQETRRTTRQAESTGTKQ